MTVTLKTEGDVSIIQMDDGKVNVFSPDMIKNFNDVLDQVPTDKGAMLIIGREGMFSAGFDLKVMMSSPENAAAMVKSGFELLMRVFTFPRPVVAACSGHAIALGAFLLCSCDHRIGCKGDFKIGANELRNNMIVPTPILELAKFRLIKSHKQRALLNAEMYSIEDAVAPGYLDEVTDHDQLFDLALAKAKDLATLAHPQYLQTKKLDQEDVAAKIYSGIETLGAIN
jgi:enoyl-CoA hydratase